MHLPQGVIERARPCRAFRLDDDEVADADRRRVWVTRVETRELGVERDPAGSDDQCRTLVCDADCGTQLVCDVLQRGAPAKEAQRLGGQPMPVGEGMWSAHLDRLPAVITQLELERARARVEIAPGAYLEAVPPA